MSVKYYFLPTKYDTFEPGSIFKEESNKLIDLDTNIKLKSNKNLKHDWIEIQFSEMKWLLKRSLTERACYLKLNSFKEIELLDKDQKCFYRHNNGYILSQIIGKTSNVNEIKFTIKLEDDQLKVVSLEDIDLYNDKNKYTHDIEELMKLLLDKQGDIQQNDTKKRCVLSLAYALPNKRFFKMFLDTNQRPLDIGQENIQSLLRKIVLNKNWHILDLVLRKCTISKENNTFLVQLCIEALRNGDNDLLGVVLQFAPNMDPLVDGETFLTNLFKENISGPTIKNVIEMNLFDVNLANKKNESPLMFACERLSKEVVEALLIHGADAQFGGFAATQKAFNAKLDTPEKRQDKDTIVTLLHHQYEKKKNRNPTAAKITKVEDADLDFLEQNLLEIMKLLVINKGDIIIFNDENVSVLSLLYDLPNKRLFQIFVDKHIGTFDLIGSDNGQNILTKIINNKDMITLKAVLAKCVYKDTYDVFLLNCALTIINYGLKSHYQMIVKKCKNRDAVIASGETFLTSCFKGNVKETIISDIIDSIYFNIDKPNDMDETPLMLACERSLVDCVRRLLNKGADRSYRDYRALRILIENYNNKRHKLVNKQIIVRNKVEKEIDAKVKNDRNPEIAKITKDPIIEILDLICKKDIKIKEKLQFTESGFIDTMKITTVNKVDHEFQIGDPVIVSSNNKTDSRTEVSGEVKWLGLINGQSCVGIESAEPHNDGFDGIINENIKFECAPGHGILATTENVKLDAEKLECKFLPSRIIDPNTYLKFNEIKDKFLLKMIGLQISDFVIANIIENGKDIKLAGVLRWSGIVNDKEYIGIVELKDNYKDGTNGRFWKNQLIKCGDKRAIALEIENISKHIPYVEMVIPEDYRLFKDINVNSPVIYYNKTINRLENMYGTVRWSGKNENNEYMYGIELEDKCCIGTDGVFRGQRLFRCEDGHGVVGSIELVAPDIRFIEIDTKDNDIEMSNIYEKFRFSIPINRARGENKGIQGNSNSSCFDSLIFALFSKSDVLDFMISYILNSKEKNETTKRFREIISWKIVYPLREYGSVSFHHIKEMRNVIVDYGGKFREMNKRETDMENVSTLLAMLCPNEQLLSLRLFAGHLNQTMYLQLRVILNKSLNYITSQQMLEVSMVQSDIMFDKPPTCLIIKVSRNNGGECLCDSILPSNVIEISNLCRPYHKKCNKCAKEATYQCKTCIKESLCVMKALYCDKHKCQHDELARFNTSEFISKNEAQMQLKAIICKEKAQVVAYVKEDEFEKKWIFFNSMSSKYLTSEYFVPNVSSDDLVTRFLHCSIKDMRMEMKRYSDDSSLKRILKDSDILVYHNTSQTCY